MTAYSMRRRTFLGGTAVAAIGGPRALSAGAGDAAAFTYDVTRTEAEWRERLGDAYGVMREGQTEKPRSSALWDETRSGTYCCRGCALPVYDSRWKVALDKGWAFYRQSEPDAMLMSIETLVPDDDPDYTPMQRSVLDESAAIEVHCRRCASHIGHILLVDGELLHCSNGSALDFRPREA